MDLKEKAEKLIERANAAAADKSGGVTRLLYSESWLKTQEELAAIMAEEGLEVSADLAGNLYGTVRAGTGGLRRESGAARNLRRAGNLSAAEEQRRFDEEIIATGSHADTVKNGGKYDGMYGIIAGIIALGELKRRFGAPDRTLKVVAFAEEEGSRFPVVFWGSRNFIGRADFGEIKNVFDEDGVSFAEAMTSCGFGAARGEKGDESARCGNAARLTAEKMPVQNLSAFVEAHIEQGSVLENEGKKIGVVTGIAGQKRYTVRLKGVANHAGTTPMKYRRDALAAAAEIMTEIRRAALAEGEPLVATTGHIEALPNTGNVVAGEAEFSIDIRHTDKSRLDEFAAQIVTLAEEIAKKHSVCCEIEKYMDKAPVPMDKRLAEYIEDACVETGCDYMLMHSGAGHDSQVIGERFPAAMIFVPSRDGISHNPAEYTNADDMARGIEVLMRTLKRLAYGKRD